MVLRGESKVSFPLGKYFTAVLHPKSLLIKSILSAKEWTHILQAKVLYSNLSSKDKFFIILLLCLDSVLLLDMCCKDVFP